LTPSHSGGFDGRGLLRPPLHQLHGERALTIFNTFQLKRTARLSLAHSTKYDWKKLRQAVHVSARRAIFPSRERRPLNFCMADKGGVGS
ncbi:MAG: hypothetical protein AAGA03_08345, partial [Planctomycetota bacterium]